jgi:hypothetical protein
MLFLNDIVARRQPLLLCARLLIQCAMLWSTPQTGIDDLRSLHVPDCTTGEVVAPIDALSASKQRGSPMGPLDFRREDRRAHLPMHDHPC